VLAAKLALLILLFGLALLNRAVLTPRFSRGDGGAPLRLCRSIAAELVIVTVILGVVGLWRFTPPPRLLAHAGSGQIETHLQTGRVMADVTLSPANDDGWTLLLELQTITLEPLEPKQVGVLLSKPAAGIEPIRHAARRFENGRWRVDAVRLPVAGPWRIEADILLNEFERVTLEGTLPVGH
jgi:copper transport protein